MTPFHPLFVLCTEVWQGRKQKKGLTQPRCLYNTKNSPNEEWGDGGQMPKKTKEQKEKTIQQPWSGFMILCSLKKVL